MAITTDEILGRSNGSVTTSPAPAADSPLNGTSSAAAGSVTGTPGAGMSGASANPASASAGSAPVGTGTSDAGLSDDKSVQAPTDVEHTVGASTDKESVTPVSEQQQGADEPQKKLTYAEMYQKMTPFKPKTAEELEKERKKQKREAIFAAIGDGISAMSNLFFTTRYAPNAYDPAEGMAATTRARFDKLKKEYDDNARQYMDGYMRAMQMDDAAGYKETLAQLKERDQKRKESETNISIALKQAEIDYKNAKTDGQAYINELYRLKGQALEAGMGAQVELIEEKIRTEQAKQKKLLSGGSGGGRGSTKRYPVFDEDGDVVGHVYTKEEAISETERNGGSYPGQQREQESEESDGRSKTKTKSTTTTTTPTAGRQPRKSKKKKKNPMS